LDPHRLIRTLKLPLLNHASPPNDPWADYLASRVIPEQEIKLAAYLRYLERGLGIHGHALEDWYAAEQVLKSERGLHPA
jgi:hypothetical protein